MFWLVGSFSNDLNETSFLTVIMNSIRSMRSTFGFVVSAMDVQYKWACGHNLILFTVAVPPLTWIVFLKVTNFTHGTKWSGLKNQAETSDDAEDEVYPEEKVVEATGPAGMKVQEVQ